MDWYTIKSVLRTSVSTMVQICNYSTEAGGCQVLCQPELHSETLLQNKTDNNNKNQSVSSILRLSKNLRKSPSF